jgi:hypothetical protein
MRSENQNQSADNTPQTSACVAGFEAPGRSASPAFAAVLYGRQHHLPSGHYLHSAKVNLTCQLVARSGCRLRVRPENASVSDHRANVNHQLRRWCSMKMMTPTEPPTSGVAIDCRTGREGLLP